MNHLDSNENPRNNKFTLSKPAKRITAAVLCFALLITLGASVYWVGKGDSKNSYTSS